MPGNGSEEQERINLSMPDSALNRCRTALSISSGVLSLYTQRIMLSEQAQGIFVISATPFLENGQIDYSSVESLMVFRQT